jgi:hypothetical protein
MMKTLPKALLACGVLSLASYAAVAQQQSSACAPAGKNHGLMGVTTRAGCPLSAVIETEDVRTTADGTRIQTKSRTLVYRSSSGRIRYETYAPAGKLGNGRLAMTIIYDPDAGFMYRLQPHPELDRIAPAQGSTVQPSPPAAPVLKSRPVIEQLGTQEMEGLMATGRRATITVLASADGNDPEMTWVTEDWESSETGILLLQTISNSLGHESVIRVTNLHLGEPDPSLFQVPAN